MSDPILTPWTKEKALEELGTRIPDMAEEKTPAETLEDRLKYLIQADPAQINQWEGALARVQEITLYASKYPMTEQMKDDLIGIGDAVTARFEAAQSGVQPFAPIGVPMQTVNIVGPIVQAVQGLNNPSAAQIAAAVQNAICNNPTAQAMSGPIIAAIQALNNPTAAEIAQAIGRVLQGQPPAGLAPVGLFPPLAPAPSTPAPAPSTPARNPLAPRTPRTPRTPL